MAKAPADITLSTTIDITAEHNAQYGKLTDGNCQICRNKGYTLSKLNGNLVAKECECMVNRRNARRIRQSGLSALLEEYTFDRYKVSEEWQRTALRKAQEFIASDRGWFVICGRPGTGKTHICTAICGTLMSGGKDVRYMVWRDEAPRLKAMVNDREQYDRAMNELKRCDVLYIDDFWKGSVTDADINLTFELLNARYNDPHKRTIISGEKSIEQIMQIDEAIGSRIWQRSAGFRLKTDGENRRMT